MKGCISDYRADKQQCQLFILYTMITIIADDEQQKPLDFDEKV